MKKIIILSLLVLVGISVTSTFAQSNDSTEFFPSWFKNVASWWTEGVINDPEFVTSAEYLINQNLIPITITKPTASSGKDIPTWFKNNVKWWTEGAISDDGMITSLEFLVDNGIIKKTQREPYSLFYHFAMEKTETQNGERITWASKSYVPHTITSGTPSGDVQLFSSSVLHKGEKISHTFEDGTYSFFCMLHPWETSTLRIPSNLEDYQKPILSFVDPDKDPYHYLDRYRNELEYKNWFDINYPYYTIYEAVGLSESEYLEFIETEKEKAAILAQKIREESGELIEYEAQRIVADFKSNSLSIVEFSNDDWKIILDFQKELMEKNKDRFDPELIRTAILIESDSSSDTLDIILDDAGLTNQFYTGYSDKLKKIFKTKLKQIDDLYVQTINKINNLDMETPKKEYYIRELDKNNEMIIALHLTAAATILQPIEEKIRVSEDKQRIRSEIENYSNESGGGCLIATATYGSELAPQVQQLRELRDNKLLQTESGSSFMNTFNDFYYTFSPIIADYERENPVLKEIVKISLTPLLTSLSLLNYVEMDTEESVLGYGISLILLNTGMYFAAPILIVVTVRNYLKSKKHSDME